MNIVRGDYSKKLLFLDSETNKEDYISLEEFNQKYNVDGLLRLKEKEFNLLKEHFKNNSNQNKITLFNLQSHGHLVNKRYAFVKIIRPGYYKSQDNEILPLLSFKGMVIAICTEIKQNIKYEKLTEDDFQFSTSNIKNTEELKKEIIERYSQSLPNYSKEELLSLGVGITILEKIE